MKYWQAQKALDEGYMIRHQSWEENKWISLHLDNYKPCEPEKNFFSIVGQKRDGWELYRAPPSAKLEYPDPTDKKK